MITREVSNLSLSSSLRTESGVSCHKKCNFGSAFVFRVSEVWQFPVITAVDFSNISKLSLFLNVAFQISTMFTETDKYICLVSLVIKDSDVLEEIRARLIGVNKAYCLLNHLKIRIQKSFKIGMQNSLSTKPW